MRTEKAENAGVLLVPLWQSISQKGRAKQQVDKAASAALQYDSVTQVSQCVFFQA